jgi:hypothetical protein
VSDVSVFGQAAIVVALLGFVAAVLRIAVGGGWAVEAARLPLDADEQAMGEGEARA